MENTATIFLYIGTILLGTQYVGKMGYISTIVMLPLVRGFMPVIHRLSNLPKRENKFVGVIEKVFFSVITLLYVVMITILFFVLLPFLFIEVFIGRPLLYINSLLNKLTLKSMEPWKDMYFEGVRKLVKGKPTKIKPTDKNLWKIAQENNIPFMAIFGVLCATIGFILKLVS